jgi:hypothetical protein
MSRSFKVGDQVIGKIAANFDKRGVITSIEGDGTKRKFLVFFNDHPNAWVSARAIKKGAFDPRVLLIYNGSL